MSQSPPPPPDKTLKELIQQAMDRHGVTSANALAIIAKKMDLGIVNTSLSEMLRGAYNPDRPKRQTIEAIATLSGASYEEVKRAFALPVTGPPFHTEWDVEFDELTRSQRDAVKAVAFELLKANRRSGTAKRTSRFLDRMTDERDTVAYVTDNDLEGPEELTPSG